MLVIEEADRSDLVQVRRLAAEALDERYSPEWLEDHHVGERTQIVVARELTPGRVVGFALAHRREPLDSHLVAIAVDPEQRGRGIGSALLRRVRETMRSRGAWHLGLEVRADDPRAQAFYRRHGFEPEGLKTRVYRDGEDAIFLGQAL